MSSTQQTHADDNAGFDFFHFVSFLFWGRVFFCPPARVIRLSLDSADNQTLLNAFGEYDVNNERRKRGDGEPGANLPPTGGVFTDHFQNAGGNHLSSQTSPYLLQHAENPVDWYPWCPEAFEAARKQDKPVFLSIGYSSCHWCHVMAQESFEDPEIAEILNRFFVSVKVDKEERPDIDSLYMSVCQAFTGNGGWPMSIFLTAEQKPFFAGTYFPKSTRHGTIGLKELLFAVNDKWNHDRDALLSSADEIVEVLHREAAVPSGAEESLIDQALAIYEQSFDAENGGFGNTPKFPSPHSILFLLQQYRKQNDKKALKMAEKTLQQMYKGGLFDHIGGGFCRYSTDRLFLVPHFEKMLYDNALLILAYSKAFEVAKVPDYKEIAEKTAGYLLSEMRSEEGGFFSAQDADSDGEEGKYYVFHPNEITGLLGEKDGRDFCEYFGITSRGNFAGKSIPNLLQTGSLTDRFDTFLPKLRSYRKERSKLHTDDKILTAWNSLTIAALCSLYRISRNEKYLAAAHQTMAFIRSDLTDGDTLYVSCRDGKTSGAGFLDDYASYIYALLAMYEVTLNSTLLEEAERLTRKTIHSFFDARNGGFYLSGQENETLISRPKESYDGAAPSGNSLMTYNLLRLRALSPCDLYEATLEKQLRYMAGEAKRYPAGYSMFLVALSDYFDPPTSITVVGDAAEMTDLPFYVSSDAIVRVVKEPTSEHPMKNGQPTVYMCENHSCKPPLNKQEFLAQFGACSPR